MRTGESVNDREAAARPTTGSAPAPVAARPTVPTGRFVPTTGTLLTPRPEASGWIAALGIAIAFAAIVEWLSLIAPVPLGGDTGTWTALSYPFIFYPHPSEIVPFGYPPLMFPILGFFVQLGGGPLVGPRLYLGFVTILLGLSVYVLGRSVFRFRVSAVLAEALLFVTVPFDRLFFFGGYPTLLGLVFFNLSLAFGLRYLRARRPAHLLYFWLGFGATLLTHEFVGLSLVVTVAIAGFFLLLKRQLPASMFVSRAGAVGMAVAGLGIGGYYLGTRFFHIAQNNYLKTNVLGHLRFPLSAVLYPLHLQALGGVIGFQQIKTADGSFAIATAFSAIVFVTMLVLAWRRPRYLTPSVIVVASSVLAILAMAIGGWILSIYTDYRRFAYSLYLPFLLVGLLGYDTIFFWCSAPARAPGAPAARAPSAAVPIATAAPAARAPPRRSPRVRRRPATLVPTVAVCGLVVVLLAGGVFAYPGLVGYQKQYSGSLHSWQYVRAMEAIQQSGIPGSILSISGGATLHWTYAMTDRNVYAPTIVSGFIFKSGRVQDDQLAYFPFHYRTVVSNGIEFVGAPGSVPVYFDASPAYGALRLGTPTSIFNFVPDAFVVTLENGTSVPAWHLGAAVPATSYTNGTDPTLTFRYATPEYNLTVTSTVVPNGPVYVNVSAQAVPGSLLREVSAGLRSAVPALPRPQVSPGGGAFLWNVGVKNFLSVETEGTVASPGVATIPFGSSSQPSSVALRFSTTSASPYGSGSLNLSIVLLTPGANSLGSPLPAVITTPGVLAGWQTRFVLLNNITKAIQRGEEAYFIYEFGATILFRDSPWEVLLLPSPVV